MAPTNETMVALIQAALQRRAWHEARALVDEALAARPDDLQLLDLGGFACFFAGDYAATERHCRRALALAPDHAYALKGLGLSLARQGRLDDGQQALERAIALRPRWFDPYWDLAIVLREGGRLADALEVLRRGADRLPERAEELQRLGAALESGA